MGGSPIDFNQTTARAPYGAVIDGAFSRFTGHLSSRSALELITKISFRGIFFASKNFKLEWKFK
jgi:hypothetical protein